jgi:hypothetical protein
MYRKELEALSQKSLFDKEINLYRGKKTTLKRNGHAF